MGHCIVHEYFVECNEHLYSATDNYCKKYIDDAKIQYELYKKSQILI
jgi:hypothetical protein